MFVIVVGHAFTHGHAAHAIYGGLIDTYLKTLVTTFSIPGTDIFVLISGYFMIKSRPSIKRIVFVEKCCFIRLEFIWYWLYSR